MCTLRASSEHGGPDTQQCEAAARERHATGTRPERDLDDVDVLLSAGLSAGDFVLAADQFHSVARGSERPRFLPDAGVEREVGDDGRADVVAVAHFRGP
jgi:hypothetical protein